MSAFSHFGKFVMALGGPHTASTTNIGRGKAIPVAMRYWYYRHGIEGYLENIGTGSA
jgi:hypothetical protein